MRQKHSEIWCSGGCFSTTKIFWFGLICLKKNFKSEITCLFSFTLCPLLLTQSELFFCFQTQQKWSDDNNQLKKVDCACRVQNTRLLYRLPTVRVTKDSLWKRQNGMAAKYSKYNSNVQSKYFLSHNVHSISTNTQSFIFPPIYGPSLWLDNEQSPRNMMPNSVSPHSPLWHQIMFLCCYFILTLFFHCSINTGLFLQSSTNKIFVCMHMCMCTGCDWH